MGKQAWLQDVSGYHSSSLIVVFVMVAGVASVNGKQA
jgi:hypothetical protein